MVLLVYGVKMRMALPFAESVVEGWKIHRNIFQAQTSAIAVRGVETGFLHSALSVGGIFYSDVG